jgi:hypothetical protein
VVVLGATGTGLAAPASAPGQRSLGAVHVQAHNQPADVTSYCVSGTRAPKSVSASLISGVCHDLVSDLAGIGAKLGLPLIVPSRFLSPLRVIFSTTPGDTATTVMDTGYFKALPSELGNPKKGFVSEPCQITIYPAGYLGETSTGTSVSERLHVFLAHEVVHCYQDTVFTEAESGPGVPLDFDVAQGLLPRFITEGSATYLATDYAGYGEQGTPGFWSVGWLGRDENALTTRSYDAVGWYSLIAHATGQSLWPKMAKAWRAYESGGASAYIDALGGTLPAVEQAWGPSVVNNPAWGGAWTTTGIGVPTGAAPLVNHGLLGPAGGSNTQSIKPWAALVDDEASVPLGIVDVSVTNGYASVHDAAGHNYMGFTQSLFCVGTKACDDTDVTCDATGPPAYLAPLAPPFTVAASSNGTEAPLTITAVPQPKTPTTPVSIGPRPCTSPSSTGYSEGDPHIGTLDGLAYDFQAAGEFTLVRSPSGALDVQVRQQPAPSSSSVAFDTAVALLDGGTRVEVDPGQTPRLLVDGKAVTLGASVEHLPGGGTIALHTSGSDTLYLDAVSVTWPNGSSALINVDELGECVAFNTPSRLAGTLKGLFAADVTSRSTPPGDEALIGGNGRQYVLDPNTMAGFHVLYRDFAPTWEVTPATSLFSYPRDKSTRSYLVAGFPSQIATDDTVLPKLRPRQLAQLEGTCRRAGITNGALLDDCVMDGSEIGNQFAALLAKLAAFIGAWAKAGGHVRPMAAPPSPTTTTTAPAPTSGSIAKYFADPCLLLPLAEVDAATHLSYSAPMSLSGARECVYYTAQAGNEFLFILSPGPVSVSPQYVPGTPVPSLGHGARWGTTPYVAPGHGELDFSLGTFSGAQYAVKFEMLGGGEARAVALARAMLANVA